MNHLIKNVRTGEFWSNALGWVGLAAADVFSKEEHATLNLPLEGYWEPLWDCDELQFARLIAEIESLGGFSVDCWVRRAEAQDDGKCLAGQLEQALDLETSELSELIERAQQTIASVNGKL